MATTSNAPRSFGGLGTGMSNQRQLAPIRKAKTIPMSIFMCYLRVAGDLFVNLSGDLPCDLLSEYRIPDGYAAMQIFQTPSYTKATKSAGP